MKNKIYKISFLLALGILFAAPLFTSAQTQIHPDGTLIRAEGNPKVFIIHHDKKRWLRNEAIFESYKHSWGAVKVLPPSEVNEIPYNNLIRADGTKVYALNDLGYKRHIFNPDIFNSYNLSWDDVADINQTELENYPDSNLVRQAGDEKVYYIEGTTRRWVKSTDAFNVNNFNWEAVQIINNIDINHYSIGVDVTVNVQVNIPETLSINGITPNQITNNQSTTVTITGNNFQNGATVKIGTSSYATDVNVLNSTTITATIPSGLAVGTYNIIVTNLDNTSATLTNAITVSAPAVLSITGITPTQILNNIDNYLTINGTNFKTGATVKIGSQSAASVTIINSTTISAKIASGLAVGTYSIQVRNPDGKTITLANALSVIAPPIQEPAELTASEIFNLVSPAVVQVYCDGESNGSGMITDTAGNILTNEHVIDDCSTVSAKLHNGTVVTGSIIGWNEVIDLAIIKINYNNLSTISFGDSNSVNIGDKVYVLGHPLGLSSATIEAGIITSKQTLWGSPYLQTDANVQGGSSGGPWVDKNSNVVGVTKGGFVYAGTDISMNMNFAIPINTAKSILSDLKAGTKVDLPDTTPPEISNIQASESFDSATITWTTDESATSKVEYGLTGSYGTTISDLALTISHSLTITNLAEGTTYYFRVISEDASNNQSVSSGYTFTTSQGLLTVALSDDTPISTAVSQGVQDFVFTKINFTASTHYDHIVTAISVSRNGLSADSDISNVKLYDGATQLGSTQVLNTTTHKATFAGLSWTIPAGITKVLTIKASIATNSLPGDLVNFGIKQASDIIATVTPIGMFPTWGCNMTIAGQNIGTFTVDAQSTPSGTVLSGTTEQAVASFKFTSSGEGFNLHSVIFTEVGSSVDSDISNIKLMYGSTRLGSTVASLTNGKATFDLSTNPFYVEDGDSKTLTLYVDVISNITFTRNICFEITQASDITAYGVNTGGAVETSGTFPEQGQAMTISIPSIPKVAVSMGTTPAAKSVITNTSHAHFGTMYLDTAESTEVVRITRIRVSFADQIDSNNDLNNGAGDGSSANTDLCNVRLFEHGSNTQIGATQPTITDGGNSYDFVDFSGLALTIPKGTTKALDIRVDIAGSSGTYYVGYEDHTTTHFSGIGLSSGIELTNNTITDGGNGASQPITITASSDTTESDPFAGVSCTITVPADYSTIQAAINAAQSGDTICVAAGTYQEESIKIIGKDIILKGAGIGQTIIESLIGDETPGVWHPEKHSAIDIQNVSSASKIEGFTIKNAYYYGIHLTNASPIIQNNEITENGLGIKIVENSQPTITYNIFSNNESYTIAHGAPLGGFVISHNTFVGNGNYGGNAAVLFNPVRFGQYMYPAEPIIVSDNIIVDGIIGVREANNVSNFIVRNNLFYNNSEANVQTLSGDYNTAEEINSLSYAENNIVADPLFISSTDYHLQDGSPAIGTASDGGNIGAY